MQVIQQTDEEKMAMYMKLPKKEIIAMLIQCNKILDSRMVLNENFVQPAVIGSLPDSRENCPWKCDIDNKECLCLKQGIGNDA